MSDADSLAIYEVLGFDTKKSGSQLLTDCPFCGKPDKLYIDPKKTTFKCHRCDVYGNNRTIMNRMHDLIWRPAMDDRLRTWLSKARKVPASWFELDDTLGYDADKNRFTFIVRNPDGIAQTVRHRAKPIKPQTKARIQSFKGQKLGIVGAEALGDETKKDWPIYFTEGEFDRIATMGMLDECGEDAIVLSLPGSTAFKKEWVEWFKGRTIYVLFDKDDGGRKGTVRVYNMLLGVAKSLLFYHWMDEAPDGCDMNDLISENQDDCDMLLSAIHERMKPEPTGELTEQQRQQMSAISDNRELEQQDMEPIGLDELYDTFSRWLKMDNFDMLDVALATVWSSLLPGNQLWIFLVAPPSGCKSEIIMPLSAYFRVYGMSTMKATSLVSGFNITPDPSLLSKMNNRDCVLAIKDLTPLLQMRENDREEVFGVLRDAYDGVFTRQYGNGLTRHYDALRFAIIAGVTPSIDVHNDVAMGERFLKFRGEKSNDRSSEDDLAKARRAIMNGGGEREMKTQLADACVRSLLRPYDLADLPEATEEFADQISKIALAIARLRAVAPTERGTDFQVMDPTSEVPARLATQLAKLAKGLAMHYQSDDLMESRIMSLVRRVALHTLHPVGTTIIQVLYHYQNHEESSQYGGLAIGEIAAKRHKLLSRETTSNYLRMYHRTQIVYVEEDGPARRYRLCDWMYDLLRETRLFHDLPSYDPYYKRSLPKVQDHPKGRKVRVRRKKVRS